MNQSEIKNAVNKIKASIMEGRTKSAIEKLGVFISMFNDDLLENQIVSLSSRFNRFNRQRIQGTISEENRIELNSIDANLMSLLREAEKYAKDNMVAFVYEAINEDFKNDSVISGGEFEALIKQERNGFVQKYRLRKNGQLLEYREVLRLWEMDEEFLNFYIKLFKKCGFNSYVWETPPVSTDNIEQPFEFVILNTPKSSSLPDYETYKEYYDLSGPNHGVVSFPNLGHDATLVVPSPYRKDANYCGLPEFFLEAPIKQQQSIWKVVAHQMKLLLNEKPIWLSVAGGGISWLHIRLDSIPKYYRYSKYSEWGNPNKKINSVPNKA
ncbi:MAG: hypothetical protein H6559_20115 [Lewinellaceae bacterium]|nr:hypothetical protein [Lewinellaceae bacterium]